jgi:hypothetical protein
LLPFDDTNNHGGEYKAWLIIQDDGTIGCDSSVVYIDQQDPKILRFPSNCAKTDNFKVRGTTDENCKEGQVQINGVCFADMPGNKTIDGISAVCDNQLTPNTDESGQRNRNRQLQTVERLCTAEAMYVYPAARLGTVPHSGRHRCSLRYQHLSVAHNLFDGFGFGVGIGKGSSSVRYSCACALRLYYVRRAV